MLFAFNSIRYCGIVVILFLASCVYSSNPVDEMADSLKIYRNLDSLTNYIKYIDQSYFRVKKYYKGNNPNKRALEIFEKFELYRQPRTSEEIIKARRYYYLYSYTYKKAHGMDDTYFNLLKTATNLVEDKLSLDKYGFKIEFQLGHYYATKNDYDKALQLYNSTLKGIKKRKEFGNLVRVLGDIAAIYKWKGQYDLAESLLKESEEYAFASMDLKAIRSSTVKLRSYFLDINDTIQFLSYYKKSNRAIENVNRPDKAIYQSQSFQEYAEYLSMSKKYNTANNFLLLADSTLAKLLSDRNRREFAKIDLSIAKNHFENSQLYSAIKYIQSGYEKLIPSYTDSQLFPTPAQIYDENTIVDLLELQSRIYYEKYKKSKNKNYLDSALLVTVNAVEANDLLEEFMIYSDSKVLSTAQNRSLLNRTFDMFFMKHYNEELKKNEWDVLRKLINKSKNSLLSEQLNINRRIRQLNIKDQFKVDSLQNNIVDLIAEKSVTSKLDSFELLINEQKEDISKIVFSDNVFKVDWIPASNYIEYIVTDSLVYLVSDLNKEVTFLKLGTRSELQDLIDRMNSDLRQKVNILTMNTTLNRMYNFLLPASINLKPQFILIPDDLMHVIPFDALYDGEEYLLKTHRIQIRQHHNLEDVSTPLEYQSIYCIAPIYHTNLQNEFLERGAIYHLPAAKEEVNYIASNSKWKVSMDTNVSRDFAFERLSEVDVFHFAGHAVASEDSTFLILNNGVAYETLHYDQILNKSINTKLVTLSACESGLGEFQYGDGINSLSRSFLGAGAKDVTYSLWNVNDQTTTEIMKRYYFLLSENHTPENAIRKSKIEFLAGNPLEKTHPYYWAAFVSTNQLDRLDSENNMQLYIVGLTCIALFFYYKFK